LAFLPSANGSPVGTIASIDLVAGTLTLAANAASAIAIGDVILAGQGDGENPAAFGTPYGIVISQIDITNTSDDVACYTSASVFGVR
jgi:hypothetical protein